MNGARLNQALARLNHIFIPDTKEGRDRVRSRFFVRLVARPSMWIYRSLSDEGRWLAVGALLIGAAGMEITDNRVYVLWCMLAGLLAAGLAVRPLFSVRGLHASVVAPRQVTVGEPLGFLVTIANDSSRDQQGLRVSRPLLPWDGTWTGPAPAIATLAQGERVSVHTHARFVRRGHHHLDPFSVSALLPLGLALGDRVMSDGCHFLAVPRIARVDRLALRVGSRYQPGGVALASQTGESMDLLGVRPYRRGDAVRDLHARSWAKRGEPVVREFQQEYFSRVGVVLDTDHTIGGTDLHEAAISLAAGVIAHLARGEALIDVLVMGDTVHPLTLGRSLGYLEQALDHLACVQPGPAFDRVRVASRLAPYLERLSSVVFVALGWNAPRAALCEEIRVSGAACRTLLVREGDDATAAADLSVVTARQIGSREPLLL